VIAISLTFALILRPRNGRPAYVPDLRWLSLAVGLALAAMFSLLVWPMVLGPVLLADAGAIAACLLTGASLRPRGSHRRGLVLGAVVYVLTGVVTVVVVNALEGVSIGELASNPLLFLLEVLLWPGLIPSYLGGQLRLPGTV
jgi:hypothetical protein